MNKWTENIVCIVIIQEHHYLNTVCYNRVMLLIILKRYNCPYTEGLCFSMMSPEVFLPPILPLDSLMTCCLYSLARKMKWQSCCYSALSDSSFECCHFWLVEISITDYVHLPYDSPKHVQCLRYQPIKALRCKQTHWRATGVFLK